MTFEIGDIVYDKLLKAYAEIVGFDRGDITVRYGVVGSRKWRATAGERVTRSVPTGRLEKHAAPHNELQHVPVVK